jgi:kumamolisin
VSQSDQLVRDEPVLVSFWLASSNPGLLEEADRVAALPIRDRTYLTRGQLKAKYRPAPQAIEVLRSFAASYDLESSGLTEGETLVHLMVSPSRVKESFGVDLHGYPTPDGSLIRGIFGLNHRPQSPGCPASDRYALNKTLLSHGPPFPNQLHDQAHDQSNDQSNDQRPCVGILTFGGNLNGQNLGAVLKTQAASNVTVVTPIDFKATAASSFYQEASLDVQLIAQSAPNAKQVLYLLPNTEQGWVTGLHATLSDTINAPAVLSISAGWPEKSGNSSYWSNATVDAMEDMLARATLIGMTVCCASGDDGPAVNDEGPRAYYPASSRFVLACGGTQIDGREVVWSGPNGASGGGISDRFPMPDWQSSIEHNVVSSGLNRATDALKGRLVPDVAASAVANIEGYGTVIGTSVAAPAWAGLIAAANQQLRVHSIDKTVGNVTTLFYDQSSGLRDACNDISAGNNAFPRGNSAYYSARDGWDACTGWGSPKAQPLIDKLLQNARPTRDTYPNQTMIDNRPLSPT